MTNEYTPRNPDLARLKRLEDEAKRLGLKPVEYNLFINGKELADSLDGIRVYKQGSGQTAHSSALVYDGHLDEEAASQIGDVSAKNPVHILVFYATGQKSVRGLQPKGDYHKQIANGQISVEIEGDGELVERAAKEIKSILEKARQRTLTPDPQTC